MSQQPNAPMSAVAGRHAYWPPHARTQIGLRTHTHNHRAHVGVSALNLTHARMPCAAGPCTCRPRHTCTPSAASVHPRQMQHARIHVGCTNALTHVSCTNARIYPPSPRARRYFSSSSSRKDAAQSSSTLAGKQRLTYERDSAFICEHTRGIYAIARTTHEQYTCMRTSCRPAHTMFTD